MPGCQVRRLECVGRYLTFEKSRVQACGVCTAVQELCGLRSSGLVQISKYRLMLLFRFRLPDKIKLSVTVGVSVVMC